MSLLPPHFIVTTASTHYIVFSVNGKAITVSQSGLCQRGHFDLDCFMFSLFHYITSCGDNMIFIVFQTFIHKTRIHWKNTDSVILFVLHEIERKRSF